MTSSPKLLVVDKSIFHTFYDCENKLCELVRKYNVVFPFALAIECLISDNQIPNKNPINLLRVFDKAIKGRARIGHSLLKIWKTEIETLCPLKSLIDENSTKLLRNGILNTGDSFIKQEAELCCKTFEPLLKKLLNVSEKLYMNLYKDVNLAQDFRQETDRNIRFEKWTRGTDKVMEKIIKHLYPESVASNVDSNWFTWQITRLWFIYSIEWTFKKNLNGLSHKKDISNDYYDIEYVLYLLRADGLLTNDKKLQVPLAKAAFPQKEVFEINTLLDVSRTTQNVFDDIIKVIPNSYINDF